LDTTIPDKGYAPPKMPLSQFVGANVIVLSPADMMKAVEWYLNEILLRSPVKVTQVHELNGAGSYGNSFEVKVTPLKEE